MRFIGNLDQHNIIACFSRPNLFAYSRISPISSYLMETKTIRKLFITFLSLICSLFSPTFEKAIHYNYLDDRLFLYDLYPIKSRYGNDSHD